MEKETKFTAQELLDSINREYSMDDLDELYKALLAYNMGLDTINEKDEARLDDAVNWYYHNDMLTSFIDSSILDYLSESEYDDEEEE